MTLSLNQRLTDVETKQPDYFYATLTNNMSQVPNGVPWVYITSMLINYDTVTHTTPAFTYSNGLVTVSESGSYLVSGSVNLYNESFTDRINLRARIHINDAWAFGTTQGFAYIRHKDYSRVGTAFISESIINLNAGDTIKIVAGIEKGSAQNAFTSNLDGVVFFNGCNFLIKKIS